MIQFFRALALLSAALIPVMNFAQVPDSGLVHQYFNELRMAVTRDHGQFWGISLDGPIFCIDPGSRKMIANCQSVHAMLKQNGDLYFGVLPAGRSSANSTMDFDGELWTMVLWPLPAEYHKRLDLMIHESFHRIQKYLGFRMGNPIVTYLDKKDGRILFRLEINALYKAVSSQGDEMKMALKDALCFRVRRFMQFPDPGKAEMWLETNEGLAQYTGYHIVYHLEDSLKAGYFNDMMGQFGNTPSLVRSSAYWTGPLYGEIFDRLNPGWNRELRDSADFLAVGMKLCGMSKETLSGLDEMKFRNVYGYEKILEEETLRQEATDKKLQEYRNKFLGKNVFNIPFKSMNIGFNPGNLVNLDDTGTVYPNCNVSDYFGTIQVKNGALLFNDWKSMNVTPPFSISDTLVKGDGWEMHLKPGWTVQRNANGVYVFIKK